MDAEPEDIELAGWLQVRAHGMVAALLEHEHLARRLDALLPKDDREFHEALAARELALMADGVAPVEIALRQAVVRATRDALQVQAAIRALPTATGRARSRPSERWRARFPFAVHLQRGSIAIRPSTRRQP